MRWTWLYACTAVVLLSVAEAHAARVVVLDVRAEADLVDDAAAATLLLRSAVDQPAHAVVPPSELARVALPIDQPAALAAGMTTLDAALVIACDLRRVGTNVEAAVLAVDRAGAVVAAGTATAGDGDVVGLVRGVATVLEPVVGGRLAVPTASVGQLRAFALAARAVTRGDLAGAAEAVAAGEPVVALRVTAIAAALRPGWTGAAADQPTALAIALLAGTPKDILELAPGTTPRERAARALARLAGAALDDAARELAGRGPRDPWLDIAAARLAHARGDRAALAAAVARLLALPRPFAPALALVVSLPAGAVPPDAEARALALARSDAQWSRLASVLAMRLAARGSYVELAAVRTIDLDDTELTQLAAVLPAASAIGNPDALRLTAELAARRADATAVVTAVDVWLAAAVDDPGAQLLRGRLALAARRLDEARDAFAAARADRELARVALARRDWAGAAQLLAGAPDDSVDKQLATIQLALSRGDAAAATAALARARDGAPASVVLLRTRAAVLERNGDTDGATIARTLADRLGPELRAELDGPVAGSGSAGGGAGAGSAAVAPSPVELDRAEPLRRELALMLPELAIDPGAVIAVVGLRGGEPPWWSLRQLDAHALRSALVAVLRGAGHQVVDGGPAWVGGPLDAARVAEVAAAASASHVLVYRLAVDGPRATVSLIYVARGGNAGHGAERTLDGPATGLVHWHRGRILGLVVLALVLAAIGLAWVIRGRSRIVVSIERDQDGSDEVLAIELSRSSRRPDIGDATCFRKDTLRAGHQLTRAGARLPSDRTVFRVAPGTWYVHLYGVYTREFGDRIVPPVHSKKVAVKRGAQVDARFDLGLPVAEVKVTIHDAQRQGIDVWLDEGHADRVRTDAQGQVTVFATIGNHTLYVDPGDLRIEKQLSISAAKIERVIINLARERRLAEVSEGLTLGPTEHGPAAAPTVDDTIGARLADDAASAPTVAASPAATASVQRATQMTEAVLAATLLGRYRLDAELGAGAMGVVYRAWDLRLERAVALKVMARAVREIPEAMAFFVQEAKSLAQLNHPNIVAVYDQVEDGTDQYMIMEFVDGVTLEKLITDRGRLPLRTAFGVIDQLCTGLAYAHGKKVIHRDIKPANVFISKERVVKLGDFGLARVMREIEIRQTDVRGTPLYMAPEQISGTNINHRADLYAVGCTLFELCTGRPPFIDGNILHHHLVTPPPILSTLCPEAPPALDQLIADCLVKDSLERVDSATDISDRLRTIAASL